MFEESKLGKEVLGLRATFDVADPDPVEKPSIGEIAGAFYRQENLIGAFNSKVAGLPDQREDDPDYNPYDKFTEEEKNDEMFVREALFADNDDELDAVRKQISRERQDRETMAKGGATSFLVGLPVMMADPLSILSIGGIAVNTYRAGRGVLKGALATASVTGVDAAIQEAALHTQQLTRTYGESSINIGFSTLLGGVLGGTVSQLSKYGVDEKMIREYEAILEVEPNMQKGINTAINETTKEVGLDSVGAQRVIGDTQISGNLAKRIAKTLRFDPLTRTLTSKNPFTRQAAVRLAENPYKMDGYNPQAAEQLAKTYSGSYAVAIQKNADLFREYKKSGGKLNRRRFNEEVARTIRYGESDIPQIKQAADSWNENLYNPLRDRMIEEKLLPEDVSISTAPNYLNRVYNVDKIKGNLPVFISKVSNWLEAKDLQLFEAAKIAETKIKDATGAEAKQLQEIIDKAEFKTGRDFEAQDYEDLASQIAQRIMGTPDGRLPYDWQMGAGSRNTPNYQGMSKLRGPLKSRVFNIDDEIIEEFLENDIEVLGARYFQQTAADVEITREFGDVDMTDMKDKITRWARQQAENPKLTEKQRKKILDQADADVRDIVGMRDRIRGVYGFTPDNVWTRIGRSSRDLNYLRLLGGVTVSSLPDVARVFMAEGFGKTFAKGLKPLIANTKNFKIAANELKRYGVGTDALMTGKSEIIADVADYAKGGTIVERGLRSTANKFGRINFLDHWTSGMKQLHAVTMQTSIFDGLSKGKFDKRLERLGISKENAMAMWKQVDKHGQKVDGVWITNAKNWDSPQLERMWGAAVRKESDRVIIIPGQEKPLFMSSELGKSIGQFRSFIMSATQRVFIAGLQGQDHNVVGGFASLVGMGMFTYYLKQQIAGRALSDDPNVWVLEGIDRSGAVGVLGEINNTIEKISSNSIGARPLLGIDAPASKQVSRTVSESILGPTFGSLLSTTVAASNAITSSDDMTESDVRTLRRLVPLQNLFYLRRGYDKVQEAITDM